MAKNEKILLSKNSTQITSFGFITMDPEVTLVEFQNTVDLVYAESRFWVKVFDCNGLRCDRGKRNTSRLGDLTQQILAEKPHFLRSTAHAPRRETKTVEQP